MYFGIIKNTWEGNRMSGDGIVVRYTRVDDSCGNICFSKNGIFVGQIEYYILPSINEVGSQEFDEKIFRLGAEIQCTVSNLCDYNTGKWYTDVSTGNGKILFISRMFVPQELRGRHIGGWIVRNIDAIVKRVGDIETIIGQAAPYELLEADPETWRVARENLVNWYKSKGFKVRAGNFIYKKVK